MSSHRYEVEVAEEVRCSRAQEPHPEWWGPASVERRRFGSAHIGTRSVETPGEAVAQRSKVVRLVVEGWGKRGLGLLLKHQELEELVLGTHSLAQCLGEGPVKLRQELAVVE